MNVLIPITSMTTIRGAGHVASLDVKDARARIIVHPVCRDIGSIKINA